MRPLIPWVIHYADGKHFSSEDGEAIDAPKDGVLRVKQGNSDLAGSPYYVFDVEQQTWYNTDFNGREARLRTRPLKTICFNGEAIPDDDWQRLALERRIGK